jgi:hypothetical protein
MKNSILVASAALLLFFAFACKNGDGNTLISSANTPTVPLPNTPEDVVRTWETQIGQNQFDAAKRISTGKTLEAVVSLDSTNNIQKMPPSSIKILNLACRTEGDKSECDCLQEDAVGQLQCTYFLVRQNGQWFLQDADSEPVESHPVEKVNKKPAQPVK